MLTRFGAEPASKPYQDSNDTLDANRELVPFSHGQHWTPVAGQSSTPVYNQRLPASSHLANGLHHTLSNH